MPDVEVRPYAMLPGMNNMANAATSAWITSAAIVSTCALVFTVGSFWWLYARQGHLKSFEPHSFAAYITPSGMSLRLPLVIYNTGAKPIVVQNLRLRFPNEPDTILPLPWRNTRSQLMPDPGDVEDLPAVFAIEGRKAVQVFIDFGSPYLAMPMEGRDYRAQVEVKMGHRKNSRPLLTFTLRAGHIIHPGNYIAYSNDPGTVSPEDQEHARKLLEDIAKKVAPKGTE
jgi:hypothetical protein